MSPVVGDQDREDMSLIVVIPARIPMRLVEKLVTTTVPCPVCRVPTGWDCAGLVCRPRRIAALQHFLGGQRC
jgi:hypothetical protein